MNYDNENWLAIIQSDLSELEIGTRATLLDDAFSLAQMELLNYSIVFELADRMLYSEAEHLTFQVFLTHLDSICCATRDLDVYTKIKVGFRGMGIR